MHSEWIYLGPDFSILIVSMEMVISHVFSFWEASKFKICSVGRLSLGKLVRYIEGSVYRKP